MPFAVCVAELVNTSVLRWGCVSIEGEVSESESERESVCVCVCVCEREREKLFVHDIIARHVWQTTHEMLFEEMRERGGGQTSNDLCCLKLHSHTR